MFLGEGGNGHLSMHPCEFWCDGCMYKSSENIPVLPRQILLGLVLGWFHFPLTPADVG